MKEKVKLLSKRRHCKYSRLKASLGCSVDVHTTGTLCRRHLAALSMFIRQEHSSGFTWLLCRCSYDRNTLQASHGCSVDVHTTGTLFRLHLAALSMFIRQEHSAAFESYPLKPVLNWAKCLLAEHILDSSTN